jgi:hypothetical protein
MEKEYYRIIKGYENYQVSNLGNIWSIRSKRKLKKQITKNGYEAIDLGRGNKMLVHRIVALNFLTNENNYPCVNHKDGCKTNNNINNLEWVSYSENEKHSYRVLGKKPNLSNLGNKGVKAKDSKQVARYDLNGCLIGLYGSASEASRETGITQGRISCNCRGDSKTCHNTIFKYISKEQYFDLRKEGIEIKDEWLDVSNRFGEFVKVKQYYL